MVCVIIVALGWL